MQLSARNLIQKLPFRGEETAIPGAGTEDIVASLDAQGVILTISQAALREIGAAGELIGRSLFDFVARDDRADVRAALKSAAEAGGPANSDDRSAYFNLLRVRRAAAPCEITFKRLSHGRISAFIRDRKEEFAQARKARIAARFDQEQKPAPGAADQPERHEGLAADHARIEALGREIKSRLIANENEGDQPSPSASRDSDARIADLSHEMKTPINAIMGFADAMRQETYGALGHEKYKEYADHIHASGGHLLELIAANLDRARQAAGQTEFAPKLSDPAEIARACAAIIRGQTEEAGLQLNIEIEDDLPQALLDARMVKQILINLLSNAVKFTAKGAVTLRVQESCGALDFIVRDTGIGMSPIMLSNLGGRYSEMHSPGVRGAEGEGLGLSIAFALARQHGGLLRLDSEPGVGTSARLTLPLAQQKDRAATKPQGSVEIARSSPQTTFDRIKALRAAR